MKLKAFDLYDMTYCDDEHLEVIKKEIEPHCLYILQNDTIGICLIEEMINIINVVKKYYKRYRVDGNFENLGGFLSSNNYDWEYVVVGSIEIDGNEFWEQVNKELLQWEEQLLAKETFVERWNDLKTHSLKKLINGRCKKEEARLYEQIELLKDQRAGAIKVVEDGFKIFG